MKLGCKVLKSSILESGNKHFWFDRDQLVLMGLGFEVFGLGFQVFGLCFEVWGLGFEILGLGFKLFNLGF